MEISIDPSLKGGATGDSIIMQYRVNGADWTTFSWGGGHVVRSNQEIIKWLGKWMDQEKT
tara:strand:+ start:1707 stop:1886 length:180 start_codon:yes stop_codon:yes gene_type:complete